MNKVLETDEFACGFSARVIGKESIRVYAQILIHISDIKGKKRLKKLYAMIVKESCFWNLVS